MLRCAVTMALVLDSTNTKPLGASIMFCVSFSRILLRLIFGITDIQGNNGFSWRTVYVFFTVARSKSAEKSAKIVMHRSLILSNVISLSNK